MKEVDSENVVQGKMLYEGKAKQVFAVDNNPDWVIIHYKDDATAFNGEKKGTIAAKGELNNSIASALFGVIESAGVATHFLRRLNERAMLCRAVRIVPLEVIIRNVAAGSMAKRLGIAEGTALKTTVFELSYKDDALGDPLINDYHAVAIGAAAGFEEIEAIRNAAFRVNTVLCDFFMERGVRLIDFKLEFGRSSDGALLLADEISPDTCRFWDAATGEKLDKDRFRRDLGGVKEAYQEIVKRVMK